MEMTIYAPNGQKYDEDWSWPPEPPLNASLCDTCVTPRYCQRENTCAQGKQLKCKASDG